MKDYPQEVLDMLDSGHITLAQTIYVGLDVPLMYTSAGFEIEHGGSTYSPDHQFQGLDSLTRSAEMDIDEVTFAFGMTDPTVVYQLLSTDIYKRPVYVNNVFLGVDNAVIHVEELWRGTITNRSSSDDDATIAIAVAGRWSQFKQINRMTTTPSNHNRRYPNDRIFDYAAQSEETVYWAGSAGS